MIQVYMSSVTIKEGKDETRTRNKSLEPGKLSTGQSWDFVAQGPEPNLSVGDSGGSCLLPSAWHGSWGGHLT